MEPTNSSIQTIIQAQLRANTHGLTWARTYLKSSQLEDTRMQLIRNRIALKRVARASGVKAAAAVFGESQVGKSYMVDCLLTGASSVLNVYDGYGHPTGFLEYINPIGGGKEATSLISRFTIDKVWKNPDFPIRVELLSPIDIIMVLVDTYYNDVKNHQLPKETEVRDEVKRLMDIYTSKPPCQAVITEDEIFELQEYCTSDLLERGEAFRAALNENGYFRALAHVIPSIGVTDWPTVFGFLWNHEPQLTDVFSILLRCYEKLDFSQTVYIKTEAVLRTPGTLLHVDRMYELFGITSVIDDKGNITTIVPAKEPKMEVLTSSGKRISGIGKSEFCAIAMEVAFTITDKEKGEGGIRAEKPFLETLDILDFPGARSRKMFMAGTISKNEACEMMLRGKVAYLFNKYSQQYLISNLLFCHHGEMSNVSTLPSLLKGWISNTVGSTPQDRAVFMKDTHGVPPLFLIGTKFNLDLKKTPDDSKGDEESKKDVRNYRWTKRFGNLINILGQNDTNNWMTQWTPDACFRNVYMLRSYEYSCQDGIFKGYQEKDPETDEWRLVYVDTDKGKTLQGELGVTEAYSKFLPLLEESFLENSFVKKHIKDPSYAWKRVTGYKDPMASRKTVEGVNSDWIPQDGSDYIIENLTKSSLDMTRMRDTQFTRVQTSAFDTLVKTLHGFYHDDNSDAELKKQLNHAGSINLSFDTLFGKDKYFFSDFIKALTIEEEHLHDVVLDTINDTKVIDQTDLSMLFAIRASAGINPDDPYDVNVNRLIDAYRCDTLEDMENQLKPHGITVDDIINPPKVLNFSLIIAEAVGKAWIGSHLNLEHYEDFVRRGLNRILLQSLFDNLEVLFRDKVRMTDRIARRIHPYVAASNGAMDQLADMLADISSEMINKFVNTVGSAYYDEEMWNDIRQTVAHNDFEVTMELKADSSIQMDEDKIKEELPLIFDSFDNIDRILNQIPVDMTRLAHFSNYEEYRKWIERMKVSFLATAGIPKYNVEMNNALRAVLIEDIVNTASLATLVAGNALLSSLKTISPSSDLT